ncbi:filamentous hemagglutinin N-terminal domain-containing protein [Azospira restricta]|uniref:Filamentous hemagglutinin N-terminal domain-containing protein n=1 Tax=Azospira restricta TaxID=404405 RepID=A0A974PWG9_9RHOO|nr:filamentous hemagglutinin N-terminal domain-containing protein [Azospira restricta]QRJ62494.1 filamentous hemagglutinin N-terminal domain-containing protein [Azospira restricta]
MKRAPRSPSPRPAFRRALIPLLVAALPATVVAAPPANTLPAGATVVNGSVTMTNPAANQLQVTNTPGAIINWNSFSIGAAALVNFQQQNAASAVLNRVTGAGGSEIYGQLTSNGRVFLINTNGILFGAGSRVDVSGLIASTRDLSNANFLAGNYLFEGGGSGNITLENNAQIRTSSAGGGQVWLFANRIDTQAGSSIQTPQGQTVLAAGDRVTVGDNGSGYMSFSVDARAGQSIEHLGDIAAERGAVGLFADSVIVGGKVDVSMFGTAHDGYGPAGMIHIAAGSDVTLRDGARLDASGGTNGSGGRINIEAGNKVAIARGADVSADGGSYGTAGGRIDIGGNEVLIEPGAGGIASVHAAGRQASADGVVNIVRRAAVASAISSYLPVSTSGGIDYYPSVAFLDDGGFIAVWMEQNAPAGTIWNVDYSTIYARRFNAAGQPVGLPFQVSAVSNYQYDPKVIGLDGGGFFVVWAYKEARPAAGTLGWEPHLGKLWGRAFDASGAPLGSEFRISNDYGESDAARIVQLAGGNFIVTWNNETSNYPQPYVVGRRGQLFGATGTPLGGAFNLQPGATAAGTMNPSLSYIVPVSGGGFAEVYQRNLVDSYGWPLSSKVFVQRYGNDGTPVGPEIALGTSHGKFFLESATTLAGGDFVIALRTQDPTTSAYKLYYGIYGADGSARRVDQSLDIAGNNSYSRLTALADGGFAALWKHADTAGGSNTDTFTRRFAADGTPLEAARALTGVPQVTGIDQTAITAGADGRYLTAWSENAQVAGGYTAYEIRAGLVTPGTTPTAGAAPIDGLLAAASYATRPGLANGVLDAPAPPVVETPPPVAETPPPVVVAPPPPPVIVPPAAPPVDPGQRRPNEVTESRHNEVRIVTPTGQSDFIYPGQSRIFSESMEVRPVVDAQGKVTRYEVESRSRPGDERKEAAPAKSGDDDERNGRR